MICIPHKRYSILFESDVWYEKNKIKNISYIRVLQPPGDCENNIESSDANVCIDKVAFKSGSVWYGNKPNIYVYRYGTPSVLKCPIDKMFLFIHILKWRRLTVFIDFWRYHSFLCQIGLLSKPSKNAILLIIYWICNLVLIL